MEFNSIKLSISTILKCPICYEEFSKKHEPMIIPCGHTICVNCVVQIIKLSEEEYESYSNSSREDEYENFFNSEDSSFSRSNDSNENSAQENESEESENHAAEEEEEEEEDGSYELKFEVDDNIQDFFFDCCEEPEDNKKNFLMGEESKKDADDGKLIKFKCSICRKKMKINSKQIIKNIQLSELIKSLDQLHGTRQYSGVELGEEKKYSKNEVDILITKKEDIKNDKFDGKIFCNLCKNVFYFKDHVALNGITDLHKKNFMFIDQEMIRELAETFDFKNCNEDKDGIISFKRNNYQQQDIGNNKIFIGIDDKNNENQTILEETNKEKEFYKIILNRKLEIIKNEKTKDSDITKLANVESSGKEICSDEKNTISLRLKEFLIGFLNVTLNYGLSKFNNINADTDFDFFKNENRCFNFNVHSINPNKDQLFHKYRHLEEALEAKNINMKDSKLYKNMNTYVDAFSNFKKCKHKSFMELSNIYLSFESHLENKSFLNAEKKLKKANKLLESFFNIFDKLKLNFALYLKGKVVLKREKEHFSYIQDTGQNEILNFNNVRVDSGNSYNENLINAKNFPVENRCFYTNEEYKSRLSFLIQRKNIELSSNYMQRHGFFNSVIKNTILSEKRYSTWVINNGEYRAKFRLYLFDNFLGQNVFCLNYEKLILTTHEDIDSGNTPTEYSDKSEVYTHNVIPDEAGLNIYFIGSDGYSKNFRVYSLAHKALIQLPNLPIEYCSVDSLFHDNKLFILGGANVREQAIFSCFYYDVFKRKWFTMPKLNIARFNKCSFINNGFIYVYGGQLGYNSDSSDHGGDGDNSVYTTQLWKFEVFDLQLLYESRNSELNNDSNKTVNEHFKWKVIEILGFNYKLMEFGFGLVDESKLIILGGSQDDNAYYHRKGFILDLNKKIIIEKLNIDYDIDNHILQSNFYRGTFQLFLDPNEEKVIKYYRIFDNLNVLI